MRFKLKKEKLLEILTSISSAIERRSTLNILTNFKIELSEDEIRITGSDLEVELVCIAKLESGECIEEGSTTIPARKLLDICKAIPAQSNIDIEVGEDSKCIIKSKHSKFTVGTLPAEDYPLLNRTHHLGADTAIINVRDVDLKRILDKTAFATAVTDVRFYLTGALIEFSDNILRSVCTDGHRLSMCECFANTGESTIKNAIFPKKLINELQKITTNNTPLELTISRELASIEIERKKDDLSYKLLISGKLIDGKYPDYQRIIPTHNDKIATINNKTLTQALQRVVILSNSNTRNVTFNFEEQEVQLTSNNNDQDEATEDFAIEFSSDELEISMNTNYLLDAIQCITHDEVKIHMIDEKRAVLITNPTDPSQKYVIMPIKV